ncbi:hypothetical protein [Variovorax sp. PCZ-1]|uniref:hypothetical protein n=1 Tax=Variovorax sp. PCZ-1 TaxID=2835533 RepID=UPI001BCD13F9|nr:hypothetical protein [Variovorax sp. PCZ-1]MBS7808872.1 hypothetical protein [Variovorax sp. PCZ-1]
MAYDAGQYAELLLELDKTLLSLDELGSLNFRASGLIENVRVQVYLNEGFGRRVSILKHCLANIYRQFPPDTSSRLTKEALHDVEIALHAFVMNLYGAFDNLAWAFVIRHDLMPKLKTVNNVGMFTKHVKAFLPQAISHYLYSETMSAWSKNYLKNYRDSLAHRIPLYIPPAVLSNEQADRYIELDRQEIVNLRERKWNALDEIRAERDLLGGPSFMFLNSLSNGESSQAIRLHPQLLCDAATLIEFSRVFFNHWHEVPT